MTRYLLRKLAYSLMLVLGVTLTSFVLMVYFGPDQTYSLLGKNATAAQIAEIHHELGYDLPFFKRYARYTADLATLDLGLSSSSGEPVRNIIARTLPISLALLTAQTRASPCRMRWEVPSSWPTETRISPRPATGEGDSRVRPGFCIATMNIRWPSNASRNIWR